MHKSQGLFLATGRKIFEIVFSVLERFSLDCRKTKTKVNTLDNQRA